VTTPAEQWLSDAESTRQGEKAPDRLTASGLVAGLTFVAAVVVALAVQDLAVGIVLLFLVFVPLEKLFALRAQKVFRRGFGTDLTHFVVNNLLVTLATIGIVVVAALPFLWIRSFGLADLLPDAVAVALAFVSVLVGGYWGHRFTHEIPFLWRFHAVHHSVEQMDWVASGRLHPIDAAFVQACGLVPLFLLGYDGAVFVGVAVFLALVAIFQHANVRLRFPVVRWIVNTPEWHHWHHARDPEARDKNYGLPVIDLVFGTAYLPKGKRATEFGIPDPVPEIGYVRHLAYPFTASARADTD
jgi:sterol desaturase/sphingolipid hydroxylase (fatty acid hydroxylase superfamily)